MRRPRSLVVLSAAVPALVPALVMLPTVDLPGDEPRPVAPKIQELPLAGVAAPAPGDPAPAPPEDPLPGSTPVVLTRALDTAPYSALGVSWRREAGLGDVAVQVRVRRDGSWSGWEEVSVEAGAEPDANSAEAADPDLRNGSDPLFVGAADGVQVRVDAVGKAPQELELALIDPGTSPADDDVTAPDARSSAAAAAPKPTIKSRASWGADESLRDGSPRYSATIKAGIVHHTATGNDYSAAQVPAIIRSMYAYHTQTLGWSDLGYNFVLDKYGTLWEARYGGVDRPVLGTHTGGFNTDTFGASIIGNYDGVTPSSASLSKLEDLLAWKLSLHGRDPQGRVTLTSGGSSYTFYPAGTKVDTEVISGHRDYSTKSCPGDRLYPRLPEIRSATAARMGATTSTIAANTELIRYGGSVGLTGKLTTATGGALGGKTVVVEGRPQTSSTWGTAGTVKTAADGTWSLTNRPARNVAYRARFAGDATYRASTSPTVEVDVRTAVTATATPSAVRLGSSVTISGSVSPAHSGLEVVRESYYDGAWHRVGTTTLSSSSTYSFRVTPSTRGRHTLRVAVASDSDHRWGFSPTVTLDVS